MRLSRGGAAVIRVGKPLPPSLHALADDREWGLFTAWNPGSQPQPTACNRAAQRCLLAELRATSEVAIHAAVGVGTNGWREPSLWLAGIGRARLDELGDRYQQRAWLYGVDGGLAQLCLRH